MDNLRLQEMVVTTENSIRTCIAGHWPFEIRGRRE
jgi:hypothetical protein